MAEVNESKSEMMGSEKAGIFTVIANEQGAKLVHPCKTAFTGKALFVDGRVEKPFTPAFDRFAVALVLTDVGNDLMVETHLARVQRVKGTIGIEESTGNGQSQALHLAEGALQMGLEVESIVMIACDNPGRSDDVALGIRDRENIGGFRSFSVLVGDTLAPFLGDRMTAIQVQLR